MKHGYEEEYKVLLTKEEFETLCNCFPTLHFVTQTNHYYNTDSSNISLRVRDIEDKQIFTCKIHTDKGLEEHEKEIIVPFWEDIEIMDYLRKVNITGPFTEWGQLTT
ncbi:MAG: CYTH domain-containing protein, partial [Erysipelotrichaceae bacterium]|nr:CYTH domain-containing protein [Erysipelotrichaceae bacterium]